MSDFNPNEEAIEEASGVTAQGEMTRRSFAIAVQQRLGVEVTEENTQFLVAWMQGENTLAQNNPLATIQGERPDKAAEYGHPTKFNSHGVKNYADFATGVRATADTIELDDYSKVLSLLQRGSGPNHFNDLANAVVSSVWGTKDIPAYNEAYETVRINYDYEGNTANITTNSTGIAGPVPDGYTAYNVNGTVFLAYEFSGGLDATSTMVFEYNGDQQLGNVQTIDGSYWETISSDWVVAEGMNSSELVSLGYGGDFQSIMDRWLYEVGLYGTDALNDPTVLGVLGEWFARPDMSEEELAGRLEQTEWWDQHTITQLEWNDLSSAEQLLRLETKAAELMSVWNSYTGQNLSWIDLDTDNDGSVSWEEVSAGNADLANWAEQIASGQATQITAVSEWIKPAALEIPNSPANQLVVEAEQAANTQGFEVSTNKGDVKDIWDRWGVEISDAQADEYAQQLYMKEISLVDVEEFAKASSNALWTNKPEDVDFITWSSPYATQYSSMLGIATPTYRDDAFTSLLTGDLNMVDFKKQVRRDERWKFSENARESYTSTYGSIGRMMGF